MMVTIQANINLLEGCMLLLHQVSEYYRTQLKVLCVCSVCQHVLFLLSGTVRALGRWLAVDYLCIQTVVEQCVGLVQGTGAQPEPP